VLQLVGSIHCIHAGRLRVLRLIPPDKAKQNHANSKHKYYYNLQQQMMPQHEGATPPV
jgi:hypothetical protein